MECVALRTLKIMLALQKLHFKIHRSRSALQRVSSLDHTLKEALHTPESNYIFAPHTPLFSYRTPKATRQPHVIQISHDHHKARFLKPINSTLLKICEIYYHSTITLEKSVTTPPHCATIFIVN